MLLGLQVQTKVVWIVVLILFLFLLGIMFGLLKMTQMNLLMFCIVNLRFHRECRLVILLSDVLALLELVLVALVVILLLILLMELLIFWDLSNLVISLY